MTNVPRMISLTREDDKWLRENEMNASKVMRSAVEICREVDARNPSEVVAKLRLVNKKLNELLAAYQLDAATVNERVR